MAGDLELSGDLVLNTYYVETDIPLKTRKTSEDQATVLPGNLELCSDDQGNLSPSRETSIDDGLGSQYPLKKDSSGDHFLSVPSPFTWSKPKPGHTPIFRTSSLPPLDWPLPTHFGQCELKIEVQPKTHHRAHYETEGSRGAVKASTGGHPVVKLLGYSEKPINLQMFIGTADDRYLRPHAFYQVHRITGKTVATANQEIIIASTKVLEIPLLPENNMSASIDCAGILKLRNSDIELRKGETDIGRKNTRVRLVFRVHIPQPNGKVLSLQTASIPVECSQRSAQELPHIEKYSINSCSVNGGHEMIVTGSNFLPESKIIFLEKGQVPGDLGNQLEAKLDKPKVVHYLCSKKTDSYFTLWLNLELLLPVIIDCWIDNVRLVYNRTSRATQFPDGVDVHVPGFGETFSLEFLDPSKSSVGSYFHTMVESLVSWGYTRGEDVRGAPYDWRRAPNENGPYFLALREMIEEMHQLYGGPVVLVAHSMGNMYTLYFLQRQPQAWKDKYIRAFVALGAPWGGVAKTFRVLASGDNNRIPVISPVKIREQQRTAVSTSWLLPYNYTWSPEKVFVRTSTTNYTLRDYRQFFQDIGFEDGWLMRQDTEGLVEAMMPPGVPLHCLYGTGVPTPDSFYYESFPDRDPKIYFGDGDGTVNLQSALQCQTWRSRQEHQVSLQELPGSEHIEMLANATTLAYLKLLLLGP
ncbi:Group XV phospholipase A2 [Myotis davidii]|uniref:Lysosomal phospholipase A and acyltransferase n=1 Tax=Myotis davidii TaxID=225400 RepID=L5LHB0_MYODS|nr:Group XV phospholipase A2 [Myotis davidii]